MANVSPWNTNIFESLEDRLLGSCEIWTASLSSRKLRIAGCNSVNYMPYCLNLPVVGAVTSSGVVQVDHEGGLVRSPWIIFVDIVALLTQRCWLLREVSAYPAGWMTMSVTKRCMMVVVNRRNDQKNKVNQSAPSRGCSTEVPWH